MKAWKHAGLMAGATLLGETANQMRTDQAEEKYIARSERMRQAQLANEQMIEATRAQFASEKDERDHSQAKELKGMELTAAEKRAAATQAAADSRTDRTIESRERIAKTRAEAPRGGSAAKPSYRVAELPEGGWGYVDPATGKFSMDESGKPIKAAPPYRERQGADKAKVEPAAAKAKQPGSSRDNPIDAKTLSAKPPAGTWVTLPSGVVTQVK